MLRYAFDRGITHFDLANNYGPPYGSAEENFGRMLRRDFKPYRNELIISTKAGWDMWPGPYGQLGGRAYLLASLDESLDRLGLDYVDIFYSHRIDPDDTARRDDRRPRHRGARGKGTVRRHLVVLGRQDSGSGGHRAAAGHPAGDSPAVVLTAQPVDRGRAHH